MYERTYGVVFAVISDCNCEPACEEQLYDADVTQAPWPHESHHLSFYDLYIYHRVSDWRRFSVYDNIFVNGTYEDLHKTHLIERNFLQINIRLTYGINSIKDTVKITPVSLVGNLGGILNLWIGFTFVTVVEICDLIYQVVMTRAQRKKERAHSMTMPSAPASDTTM